MPNRLPRTRFHHETDPITTGALCEGILRTTPAVTITIEFDYGDASNARTTFEQAVEAIRQDLDLIDPKENA